eukprot:364786-Chlamydomonas_euryale.AAC.11
MAHASSWGKPTHACCKCKLASGSHAEQIVLLPCIYINLKPGADLLQGGHVPTVPCYSHGQFMLQCLESGALMELHYMLITHTQPMGASNSARRTWRVWFCVLGHRWVHTCTQVWILRCCKPFPLVSTFGGGVAPPPCRGMPVARRGDQRSRGDTRWPPVRVSPGISHALWADVGCRQGRVAST